MKWTDRAGCLGGRESESADGKGGGGVGGSTAARRERNIEADGSDGFQVGWAA